MSDMTLIFLYMHHLSNAETGRGRAFPGYTSNSARCSQNNDDSYFGNELNFAAVPGMIVTGAA